MNELIASWPLTFDDTAFSYASSVNGPGDAEQPGREEAVDEERHERRDEKDDEGEERRQGERDWAETKPRRRRTASGTSSCVAAVIGATRGPGVSQRARAASACRGAILREASGGYQRVRTAVRAGDPSGAEQPQEALVLDFLR